MTTTIHTKSKDGEKMVINIRLSDPCNNGHNNFSITGNIYKAGMPKTDRNHTIGGCIHDEILAVKPTLKPFVDLHLSDERGLPMYAVENGFYWFCTDIEVFAKYMRVDFDTARKLKGEIHDKKQFTEWVETMKPVYLEQANAAKKLLQSLIN